MHQLNTSASFVLGLDLQLKYALLFINIFNDVPNYGNRSTFLIRLPF